MDSIDLIVFFYYNKNIICKNTNGYVTLKFNNLNATRLDDNCNFIISGNSFCIINKNICVYNNKYFFLLVHLALFSIL